MTLKEQCKIANDPDAIIEELVSARLDEWGVKHTIINFKFERKIINQVKIVLMSWFDAKRRGKILVVREYTNRLLILLLAFPFITRNVRFIINHNISTGSRSFLLHIIASYLGFSFILIDGRPLIPFFRSLGLKIDSLESSKHFFNLECSGKSALVLGVEPEQVNEHEYLLTGLALGPLVFAGRSGHKLVLESREDYLRALSSSEVICFLPSVFAYSARNSGTLWDAKKLDKWIITWDLPIFREQLKGYTKKILVCVEGNQQGLSK